MMPCSFITLQNDLNGRTSWRVPFRMNATFDTQWYVWSHFQSLPSSEVIAAFMCGAASAMIVATTSSTSHTPMVCPDHPSTASNGPNDLNETTAGAGAGVGAAGAGAGAGAAAAGVCVASMIGHRFSRFSVAMATSCQPLTVVSAFVLSLWRAIRYELKRARSAHCKRAHLGACPFRPVSFIANSAEKLSLASCSHVVIDACSRKARILASPSPLAVDSGVVGDRRAGAGAAS